MSPSATCWVLNLDAEIELDRLQDWIREKRSNLGSNYATAKPLREKIAPYAARFAALLPPNALILNHSAATPTLAQGCTGLCWCPTPSALEQLKRSGAKPIASPAYEILLNVNYRRFCAELGQTLPDARFIETADGMNALLQTQSPTGAWLCKRPLGFAGRGQRRIVPIDASNAARTDDQRWLNESLVHGGLQIEPFVEIIAEYSVHGLVRRDGSHTLGKLCQQQVDEHRAWSQGELAAAPDLSPNDIETLHNEAKNVATALTQAGYFGPFCVDSYTWRHTSGAKQLNARSEINARMTMAYPIGMGENWLQDLSQSVAAVEK